jgi:hypothetical protein
MFDPDMHPGGNLQLGVGVKIPTGQNNATDTFQVLSGNTVTNQIRTVDQSIQAGDGGFGILVDFSAFSAVAGGKMSVYADGAYLSTPGEKSNVQTYRTAPGEEVMSIADQYLARGGVAFPIPKSVNMTFSSGLRLEGVPVRDIIGGDGGFRRPDIAVSFEPAVNMIVKGKSAVEFVGAANEPRSAKAKVRAFMQEMQIPFPVWLEASEDHLKALGVGPGLPATVIVDAQGRVARGSGASPTPRSCVSCSSGSSANRRPLSRPAAADRTGPTERSRESAVLYGLFFLSCRAQRLGRQGADDPSDGFAVSKENQRRDAQDADRDARPGDFFRPAS